MNNQEPILAWVNSDRELRKYCGKRLVLARVGRRWVRVYPSKDLAEHPIRLSKANWEQILLEVLS